MASIGRDQFYINFLHLDREETAILLALLLAALQCSDEQLAEMGTNIGDLDEMRFRILDLGLRLDEDWPAMVKAAEELCSE